MDIQGIKNAYFNLCVRLNQPPRNVVLSAGAALVLLEVRDGEAEDLDVDVPVEVYERQSSMHPMGSHSSSMGSYVEIGNNISLHKLDRVGGTMEIDGVYMYDGLRLLEQKIKLLEMPDRKPEKIARDILELDLLMASLVIQQLQAGAPVPPDLLDRAAMLFGKYWKDSGK